MSINNIIEIKQNILNLPMDYYIIHCIGADYKFTSSLSITMNKKYHLSKQLRNLGEREYPDCILINNIFNLVVKYSHSDDIYYSTLQQALQNLSIQIDQRQIHKIAIPEIYCKDKSFYEIRTLIYNTLMHNDLAEILICHK